MSCTSASPPETDVMDRLYFEDFPPGETAEYGDYAVTAEEIMTFARAFDPQPFHLDEVAARETMAGGPIASGWHSAAIMMRINCDEVFLRSSAQPERHSAGVPTDRYFVLTTASRTLAILPTYSMANGVPVSAYSRTGPDYPLKVSGTLLKNRRERCRTDGQKL